MNRRLTIAMFAAFVVSLVVPIAPVSAQPGPGPHGRRGMDRQAPPPERPMPPPGRGWEGRDFEQRRGMTPEERRQLRRDISDHGRDIYREPREGRPRQP